MKDVEEMAFEQILEGIVCMQKHVQRPCGGNMFGNSKMSNRSVCSEHLDGGGGSQRDS